MPNQTSTREVPRWGLVGYWTCAAGTCLAAAVPFMPERWLMAVPFWYLLIPIGPTLLWIISYAGLRHFTPKDGHRYRWFLVTAPFANFWLLEGVAMTFFWLFTGFAP